MPPTERIRTLRAFYPYYLSEHRNSTCRRLHVVGTGLLILTAAVALATQIWWLLWLVPVIGYGFAWVGHAFFEHNRPATFQYPLFSLASDFWLFADTLRGRQPF
jgi:hypothetical protein